MNDDMPWVDLTPEEIQELRTNKQQLTEYGKQKIRELQSKKFAGNYPGPLYAKHPDLVMTHEEMLEEAARREAINKEALESMGIDYENFGQKPWDESMLEEAAKREAIVAQVSEEDYQKVLDAAKEKQVLEIAKNFIEEHSEAMEQLAEIERKEFYRFFAVEYFGTGEGMSFWLKICRNYGLYDGKDYELQRFKEFIGCDHYFGGIEELKEDDFVVRYASLIPAHVTKMLANRDQPGLDWETHFHVNYS